MEENNIVKLSFSNIEDYNKCMGILYENGFKRTSSPNKGNGYYIANENWKTIKFPCELKGIILPLINGINYKITFLRDLYYKIFTHGGYLD